MDVYFAFEQDCTPNNIVIRHDEAKHIARVARKQVGDYITVTPGNGMQYIVQIERITRTEVYCSVVSVSQNVNELPVPVALAVSLLKNPNRFDFCIEKATELGVSDILPFTSSRTVVRRASIERWQLIARSAMKQSGRCVLPRIAPVLDFPTLLNNLQKYSLVMLAHEKQPFTNTITQIVREASPITSILFIVGPEGGFTDEEVEHAHQSGCLVVNLGKRRLRSETAALVGVSTIVNTLEQL
ncbi:MAG: 16S rRNA (uracil(1498)-N(3))-methyltransferase [Bacteroidetes bacterium]|nr:16S rRNA (uracil(1498)-N(3))-methyltransferase [Bacteroidota bacterium]